MARLYTVLPQALAQVISYSSASFGIIIWAPGRALHYNLCALADRKACPLTC